jgi:dolichol-phosphate mannosyltransferase
MIALSVILPTYNEAENLPPLVKAIAAIFQAHNINGEIIVVDDNSPDGTGQIADDLSKQYPVRVVHRPGKLGLATAALDGFRKGRGEILCIMDVDGSHPPAAIVDMFEVLRRRPEMDCVVGSRYVPGGATKGWPFYRHLASWLARAVAWPITSVRDSTSGFLMFRCGLVSKLRAVGGFKIGLEILCLLPAARVAEVPITFNDRAAGQSKMGRKEITAYLRHLPGLYKRRFLKFQG